LSPNALKFNRLSNLIKLLVFHVCK
jgi:hypothetical protein